MERGLKDWIQIEKAVERTVDARDLSFEMNGLVPDSWYKVEIRATNEIGNSLPESVVIKTSKGKLNVSARIKTIKKCLRKKMLSLHDENTNFTDISLNRFSCLIQHHAFLSFLDSFIFLRELGIVHC